MAAQMSDNFAAVAGRVILNSECIRFEGKITKINHESAPRAVASGRLNKSPLATARGADSWLIFSRLRFLDRAFDRAFRALGVFRADQLVSLLGAQFQTLKPFLEILVFEIL